MKWKTKDGREIDVQDMTDTHLLNSLTFMRRLLTQLQTEENSGWTAISKTPSATAKEMLASHTSAVADRIADVEGKLDGLITEARRRKWVIQ